MAVAEALKHLEKATSDSERIAALLLVSGQWVVAAHSAHSCATLQVAKVVKSGEVSQEDRRKVFDAVGFSFINRLLSTSKCTSQLPPPPSP